ncbi:MAG: HAD family phosphatase [Solirubrobacterales bacterium]|nr:HAD family phosphatase [Solirubrobacterales bacterium]
MLRALLLDFDGLLYDTETPAYAAWVELFHRFGQELDLAEYVRELIGRPPGSSRTLDPAQRLREVAGLEVAATELRAWRQRLRDELLPHELMPGAAALLRGAAERGLRAAIVSSNSRANVDEHLARAGVTFEFDAIVCADGNAARGKPAPTLYLEALAELGLRAGEAVAFEDSPNGIAAAKAAGLRCIAIPNDITRGAPGLERADVSLRSLTEVDLGQLAAPDGLPA